jgi:hypothetical protein
MAANAHTFNVQLAKDIGLNKAILLQHLYYWHQINHKKKNNVIDGNVWTYNTIEEFHEIFPYLTPRKISYAFTSLHEDGFIKVGNYNKAAFDKTKWYSLTEKALQLFVNSNLQNVKSGEQNVKSGEQNVNAIPDSNTDNKPDNNKKYKKVMDKLIELYPKNRVNSTGPILKYLQKKTDTELKQIILAVPKYLDLAGDYVKNLRNYLEHECWTEEWLQEERKKKNPNKKELTGQKTFKGDYGNI